MTTAEQDELIRAAQWAVDAFDQANTNSAVWRLGSRGRIAGKAINELRQVLMEAGHPPSLPAPIGETDDQEIRRRRAMEPDWQIARD